MTTSRFRWALVLWGVLGGAVLVGTYLVMVRHGVGQRLDFSAFEGRKWTLLWARRRSTVAVRLLTPVTVVVVVSACTVVALRSRGVAAAVATALSVPAAALLAMTFKASLPRDDLLSGSWVTSANTYPSGHTAAIVTTALVAVSVSPPRWRPMTAGVAVLGVAAHTVGMSGTGWHRPSDLIGGIGLGVLIAGWSALAVTWRGVGPTVGASVLPAGRAWYRDPRTAAMAVGLAAGVGLMWSVALRLLGAPSYGRFAAHLAALVGTVAAVSAAVVVHANLLDGVDGVDGVHPVRPDEGAGAVAADSVVR
jgi:hypothetical protein